MFHHIVPENRSLSYYLDQELEVAKQVKEPTFFTWIVAPTVIYGRHQILEQEVNLEYCREHHVDIVQRQSGGGCVYADGGNVMLSYIVPSPHSQEVFDDFLSIVSKALQKMGYDAVTTQHNDILVNGRKVSGTACYSLSNATIVHATMLYDVDFDALEKAITPSREKLEKHAVQSVRQRVQNLRSFRDMGDVIAFRAAFEQIIFA